MNQSEDVFDTIRSSFVTWDPCIEERWKRTETADI